MAAACTDFEEWLGTKLQALNTDQEIFGGYIKGILDTNDSTDEKLEALEGILVEVSEDGVAALCKEILAKWTLHEDAQKQLASQTKASNDFDAKLAVIMVEQAKSVVPERRHAEGDKNYRDAILAQYSQVSDNDDDFDDVPGGDDNEPQAAAVGNSNDLLFRNTNAESVMKAEKEKRDKAKAEVEKKKALDKASREKQKQVQQERKDKEKKRTQKGEKRR